MAAHVHRVGDFPFPSLPLSHTQDFSDYFNHPSILFHPHQLLQVMHQATTDAGGGEDWMLAVEADYEDSASASEAEDPAEGGIEDWMLVAEAGDDEDLMEDYDADEEGFADTPERDGGLPAEVIAGFLKTNGGKAEASGGVCAVCLDDLYGEDRMVGILGCSHGFHDRCIGEWLRKKNTCPLCRAIAL